ncbi:MAG: HAMP domain-containing sensor histidine kinase, partial [Actinomycetota bacterium]
RVTLAYAFGALLLSLAVALSSYAIALNRLLSVEENGAEDQFIANATQVRKFLESAALEQDLEVRERLYADIIEVQVRRSNGSRPLLISPDNTLVGQLIEQDLPLALREAIVNEQLAKVRFQAQDEEGTETRFVIGISFEDLDAKYYEVLPLGDLESTLTDLRRILIGVAVLASLAGAGLGYYSARRALAPVSRISTAAQAIAAGDFKTRLDLQTDPDLAVLSSSFNDMVDALGTRIERDERFASDVSHELRSPLMTLTASLEVLERRKASLPDVAQTAVDLLRDDLTRFENLVEDLLEISRMDAGAVELDASAFGLSEFLFNVIAQSRSPEIELNHPEKDRDLVVMADKRRMAQVVTNLIDNAKKYGGGATGISFRQIGDYAQIVVEDRGPGVPMADRQLIFHRFSRTTSDAGSRGTDTGVGLGLSLVAEHVRLHEGRVWVTDRVDNLSGARFVVEFPIGEGADDTEEMAV